MSKGASAAKDAVLDKGGDAARSALSGMKTGAESVSRGASVAKDVVLDKGGDAARSALSGMKTGAESVSRGASVAKDVVLDKGGDAARSALSGVKTGAESVSRGASVAKDAVLDKGGDAARSALSGVKTGAESVSRGASAAKDVVLDKGGGAVRFAASGATAGFLIAYKALTGFSENLDWNSIDPTFFLNAGTRGVNRGMEQARLVWESVPVQLRALGPEDMAKWLDGFDWSHIIPVSAGGSNEASNGMFELASLNRSRGASTMTASEIQAAKQVLADQAFKATLFEAASQAVTAAAASAAVECVLASLEYGLQYYQKEIDRAEMYRGIGLAVGRTATVGGAISGLMTIMALAFPPLIPLVTPLMIPVAVLGLCAVGGRAVRIGKGWYPILKSVCVDRFPEVFPIGANANLEALASK